MTDIWKKFFAFLKPVRKTKLLNRFVEMENQIDEQQKKAAETESAVRWLQAILNSMSEGVIAVDSNLKIILVNPLSCSIFGHFPGQGTMPFEGKTLLEFTFQAELEDAARQVLTTGKPCELIVKRYNSGVEQHFRTFVTPMEKPSPSDSPCEVFGVVIVLGDISRLVKLEQVRKDFAANVSHELRTPIQIVKGFAENILESSMDNKKEIRRFTEIISKNVCTMENLTNDLLTLVSLEDGNGLRPSMKETEISPLIDEAVGMVAISSRKKEITVDVSCPADLSAKIYSGFIIQALVNLLDNGIKYSDSGSRIKVKAFREGERLVIEVKDNGIGIRTEHINRIFERFYRVDQSRSREVGGTGLGLAIVRHIALLHNGTAEVESHAGEGSLFRLNLPQQR